MVGRPRRDDGDNATGDTRPKSCSRRQLRDDGREGCRRNATVHDDNEEQDTRD